ncbi:14530_t:CDS:2, partial [Gigaspora rosea]
MYYRHSSHRVAICRENKSWLVREILYSLQVLDLHQILELINIKNISNPNASYYKYQPVKNTNPIWIPLLPGYTIYTKFNNKFFKLSIWKTTQETLIFLWWMYNTDEKFENFYDSGFCDDANLQYLQSIVLQKYPNIFKYNKQLTNTLHQETLLRNNLGRMSLT